MFHRCSSAISEVRSTNAPPWGARLRIASAGSSRQISIANNENRLPVRVFPAAHEYLHFVLFMSTVQPLDNQATGLEK